MGWSDEPAPYPLPPDESRFWEMALVSSLGFALALLTVSGRLFTRIHLLRSADWSDIVLGVALVLDAVGTAMTLAAGGYGAGRHIYYLSPDDIKMASLIGTAGVPFGQMSMALPKIAAVGVLVRIAGPSAKKWIKPYLYTLTGLLCVLSVIYCIFLFVQCTPAFALWTQVPDSTCWDPRVIAFTGIGTAVVSVFVDLNIALYPIFIMKNLQMDVRKKISVCILMGLGITATICAAFKIPHLRDQTERDITWAVVTLSCWTQAEINLVMITASVPLLRPLWLYLTGKPFGSGTSAANSNHSKRTSKRGFMAFGSKKDSRNELTIDVCLDETTAPRDSNARMLMTPPPKPFSHPGGIHVEKSVTVTHEEV